jgi:hypothetical protein
VYPGVEKIVGDAAIEKAALHSVGLDGPRSRKAVLSALADSKAIAIDPSKLTAEAVLRAIESAQRERSAVEANDEHHRETRRFHADARCRPNEPAGTSPRSLSPRSLSPR